MIQHRAFPANLIARYTLNLLAILLSISFFPLAVLAADLHLHWSAQYRGPTGPASRKRVQVYTESYDIYVKGTRLAIVGPGGRFHASLDTGTVQFVDSDGHLGNTERLQDIRKNFAPDSGATDLAQARRVTPVLTPTGEMRTIAGLSCSLYHGKTSIPSPQSTMLLTDLWACMTTVLPELEPFREILFLIPSKNRFMISLILAMLRTLDIAGVPLSITVTFDLQETASSTSRQFGTGTLQTDRIDHAPIDEHLLDVTQSAPPSPSIHPPALLPGTSDNR